jgi:hypothetical protein
MGGGNVSSKILYARFIVFIAETLKMTISARLHGTISHKAVIFEIP